MPIVTRQVFIDFLRDGGVVAHDDEDGRIVERARGVAGIRPCSVRRTASARPAPVPEARGSSPFDSLPSFPCLGLLAPLPLFRQILANVLVKIPQHRHVNFLRVVAVGKKGNLHQPGLDGFDQSEVGNNPLEQGIRLIARAGQIIGRGAEVVDAAP